MEPDISSPRRSGMRLEKEYPITAAAEARIGDERPPRRLMIAGMLIDPAGALILGGDDDRHALRARRPAEGLGMGKESRGDALSAIFGIGGEDVNVEIAGRLCLEKRQVACELAHALDARHIDRIVDAVADEAAGGRAIDFGNPGVPP